ncbi:ABC transporter permease [Peribacillus frigoritolerans]|uniref:ABC transporter permease n=1 Tax=Peribacillus frigoritolerans TaxID=450367 RepID=UPI0010597398|nr:ABC transporter permease [Peribacillus frigoritolerans]TDL82776.1 FtsX-like permease family protein [Peribacillus frigoritolerans]
MIFENLKMSWMNIIHHKMRSFLTILGIVIGVASIIALITIVKGATGEVTEQMSSLGADKVTVQVQGTAFKQGLLNSDIKELEGLNHVSGVSPTLSGKSSIVYSKNVMEEISIQGKNQVHFRKTEDLVEAGRAINKLDIENKNKVVLIGAGIVKELFWGKDPIGEKMQIGGVNFQIIGTLQESDSYSNESTNETVIMPYTTAMRFLETKSISNADIYMDDSKYSEAVTSGVERVVHQAFNYKDEGYSIMNMGDMISSINEITSMMTLMLGGIASISLVVGGIGIMNMMLVSVTERTAEIGLRKALGAEPKRIQQQFLFESVFLSLFGGLIGLLAGVVIAFLVCSIMGTSFSLSASTVLLAVGFSAGIGILFGFAPARKASRLHPIDALRSN